MSFIKRLRLTLSAMFGEPCDRCSQTIKTYPVFGLPLGPELGWVNRILTLDQGGSGVTLEADVVLLAERVHAYAADPRPHTDGIMAFVKWCKKCQQGTLLLKLSAHGSAVEESEYSLFSEGHKRFAQIVQDRYDPQKAAAPREGPAARQAQARGKAR